MSNKQLDTLRQSLPSWVEASIPCSASGKVASYIPELSKAPHDALGITIIAPDGELISAGDCSQVFTLQSISKVFTLILALMDNGEEEVFKRVGMEQREIISIPCLSLSLCVREFPSIRLSMQVPSPLLP